MKKGMIVSHLWRTGKRTLAIVLIGLTVAILAVPETSLAANSAAVIPSEARNLSSVFPPCRLTARRLMRGIDPL